MPSTDRWLWLLQMALFLSVPVYLIVVFIAAFSGDAPVDCGTWIFTDPSGDQLQLKGETCPTDAGSISAWAWFFLSWLGYCGLGAVIFCLRRIGKAMGAD